MTQIPVLKKDFEIAISSIQNRIEDLSKNSEKLISYIRPNKNNKNVLHSGDGTMLSLEKKYLKCI